VKNILLLFISIICSSCTIRYSPYDTFINAEDSHQIEAQKARLGTGTSGADFSFALISDTHFFISALDNSVKAINTWPVQFTVNAGDFSNQGLKYEYTTFLSQLRYLNQPFFTVIGNHDSIAFGKDLYHEMFVSENYTFEYNGVKFIFFNTNNWEWGFIDYDWLNNEINNFSGDKILISHISIDDDERFSDLEKQKFAAIVNGKVKLAIAGHKHSYGSEMVNGTLHYIMTQTKNGETNMIKYMGGHFEIYRCNYAICDLFTSLP
jgi:Icc protein